MYGNHYTNSKLYSSSKIINHKFDYISLDSIKYLKSINLATIKNNISNLQNKKVLAYGEPIIDTYEYVKPSGKSNKASIISTIQLHSKSYGGGAFLVSNLLNDYIKKLILFTFTIKIMKIYLKNT